MNNTGSIKTSEKDSSAYIQQLCLGLVVKILEKSRIFIKIKFLILFLILETPFIDSFILDSLVKVIRFAHTPSVLPNALKVLTLIAPKIPVKFLKLFIFLQKIIK